MTRNAERSLTTGAKSRSERAADQFFNKFPRSFVPKFRSDRINRRKAGEPLFLHTAGMVSS
jgi:hypothetical protein